jgi:hypothetical protein
MFWRAIIDRVRGVRYEPMGRTPTPASALSLSTSDAYFDSLLCPGMPMGEAVAVSVMPGEAQVQDRSHPGRVPLALAWAPGPVAAEISPGPDLSAEGVALGRPCCPHCGALR